MTPEQAATAIGAASGDDYILKPLKHADELPELARPLAEALRDSHVRVLAEQYARHDEAAGAAQATYRSTLFRANCAVFVATALGAVMMAAEILASTCKATPCLIPTGWLHPVALAAGILAGLAAIASSMWLFKAREGQLLERWLNFRARAEAERGGYFSTLAAHAPDDIPLRLLKLEYFRR